MFSKDQAREKILEFLSRMGAGQVDPLAHLVIMDSSTEEHDFGWIFFYGARGYVEGGDLKYALGGNAPVIIDREIGELHLTGTTHQIDFYVSNFKKTGNPHIGLGAKVRFVGFEVGANKVGATKAVRASSTLGLAGAKRIVDACLEGSSIQFKTTDCETAEKLVQELSKIGFLAERMPDT